MRVLVTGAAGLLGGRLAQLLAAHFDVVAGHHMAPVPDGLARVPMDLESAASIESAIESAKPDAVLHAGAYAMVDLCERDPERAERINVHGSEAVARACASRRLRVVGISTDLVLAGDRAHSDEAQPARPVMTYGRTKLAGEEALLAAHPGGAVARVPLIVGGGFGPRGSGSESVAWALRAGRRLTLFTDQYRTPCDAASIARALAALLAGTQTGRFHLGGRERVSRHELGLRVAAVHRLSTEGIEAVRSADVPSVAPRADDVSLDSRRAERELGFDPAPLDAMIRTDRPAPGSTGEGGGGAG
jgi:dTDP-4-dehydrorhamnose reductase